MQVHCDNDDCIYDRKRTCRFTHITLDALGICQDGIRIVIPDAQKKALRKAQRRSLEAGFKKGRHKQP